MIKNFFYLFWKSVIDVTPLIVTLLFFAYFIADEPPPSISTIALGFFLALIGLFTLIQGLEMGLFPLGESLANSFAAKGSLPALLVFAATIGYSTTIAEPALIAIADKAAQASAGRIDPLALRHFVAGGVALGVTLGTLRILLGHPIQYYIGTGYILTMLMTIFAPREIIGIAYDSGGVTTSTVTVPLVTALGIGLASAIEGRSPLIDGFGLIAFASLTPMMTVMLYGVIAWNV